MLNGQTIGGKIQQGQLTKKLLDEKKSPQEIIESFYIRALTRKPSEAEMKSLMEIVTTAENPQQGLDDVFWAVLNSREFLFNH